MHPHPYKRNLVDTDPLTAELFPAHSGHPAAPSRSAALGCWLLPLGSLLDPYAYFTQDFGRTLKRRTIIYRSVLVFTQRFIAVV